LVLPVKTWSPAAASAAAADAGGDAAHPRERRRSTDRPRASASAADRSCPTRAGWKPAPSHDRNASATARSPPAVEDDKVDAADEAADAPPAEEANDHRRRSGASTGAPRCSSPLLHTLKRQLPVLRSDASPIVDAMEGERGRGGGRPPARRRRPPADAGLPAGGGGGHGHPPPPPWGTSARLGEWGAESGEPDDSALAKRRRERRKKLPVMAAGVGGEGGYLWGPSVPRKCMGQDKQHGDGSMVVGSR